jgi:hypothetical protein
MMAADLDVLAAELGELRGERDRLIATLTPSVEALRTHGAGPAFDLLQALRAYRQRHQRLETQCTADAALSALGGRASLDAWEHPVHEARHAQKLAVFFDALHRCELRSGEMPGPLARVWEDADRVRQRISGGETSLAEELLAGRHPLALFLQLVRQGEELADAEWTELQDRVSECYGRELSTAIARGRIVLREELSDQETEVSP